MMKNSTPQRQKIYFKLIKNRSKHESNIRKQIKENFNQNGLTSTLGLSIAYLLIQHIVFVAGILIILIFLMVSKHGKIPSVFMITQNQTSIKNPMNFI